MHQSASTPTLTPHNLFHTKFDYPTTPSLPPPFQRTDPAFAGGSVNPDMPCAVLVAAADLNVASSCWATVPHARWIDCSAEGLHATFAVLEISFTFMMMILYFLYNVLKSVYTCHVDEDNENKLTLLFRNSEKPTWPAHVPVMSLACDTMNIVTRCTVMFEA